MRDVILHTFDWPYREISVNAARIAEIGYGAVLIPPPFYSDVSGSEWWHRYQPKDYRVLRSFLGNKADLEKMIVAMHGNGVRVYVDIVFNRMADENRPDYLNFPGDAELERYRKDRESFEKDRLYGNLDEGLFSPWDFYPGDNIQDWMDAYQSTEFPPRFYMTPITSRPKVRMEQYQSTEFFCSGRPELDLDLNQWVVDQQRECLRALNDLGFDGYRIHVIKHLPLAHIRSVFETSDMVGKFLFGEAIALNDNEEVFFLWPLLNDTGVVFYDFPLHETLCRAFSPEGSLRELVDPAANGQALPWHRALNVVLTHDDIPNNVDSCEQPVDRQDEFLAKVYMMGRAGGVPLVCYDYNESTGIYPEDRNLCTKAWCRDDLKEMIAFHNAVYGLPQRALYEADGFLVLARGDCGIVAINKTDYWQNPSIWTWGLRQGSYQCLIHGHLMQLSGDTFRFSIPPRQAQMWLAN